MKEMTKEEFINYLIKSGHSKETAEAEWEYLQSEDGDVDGDMDL